MEKRQNKNRYKTRKDNIYLVSVAKLKKRLIYQLKEKAKAIV